MRQSFYTAIAAMILLPLSCQANPAHGAAASAAMGQAKTAKAQPAPRKVSVNTILAEAKVAMGGATWDRIKSIHTQGTTDFKAAGLVGSTTQLIDLHNKRSVTHNHFGDLHTAWGVDGKAAWLKTPSGIMSTKGKPAIRKMYLVRAYQAQSAWWYRKRWPAKIITLGEKNDAAGIFQVLEITPQGGDPFELWINAETHRIARFVSHRGPAVMTIRLGDYRTVHGIKIAFHRQMAADGKTMLVTQLQKVAVNVPVAASDFAMPKAHGEGFSLIGHANTVSMPFAHVGNWIYVDVTVDGHPLHFLVDSNTGPNVITPQAAKAIGLQVSTPERMHLGGGANAVSVGRTVLKSLRLGGVVAIRHQPAWVMPLPQIPGHPVDGLVGAQFFHHFVIRVDYARHQLTFIKPKTFDGSQAGTAVALDFHTRGAPVFHGSIDGIAGRFVVDTGSFAPLTLHSPFAKAHHLYTRYHAAQPVTNGAGLGGAMRVRTARGGTLRIGRVVVNNPLIDLSTATQGAYASAEVDGSIAGEILKRFTVTFDFPHKRMYLKPNKKS